MSYLLFVRSLGDLDRACREVSEFFAFQSRQPSSIPPVLHGVWIEPDAVLHIPLKLAPPSSNGSDQSILVRESFGVSGIWELALLRAPSKVTFGRQFPDPIIESLRGLAAGAPGLFAPVFTGGMSREEMGEALGRLQRRHPGVLTAPLVQHPGNGALETLSSSVETRINE